MSLDSASDTLRPDKHGDDNVRTPASYLIIYSSGLDVGEMAFTASTGLTSAIVTIAAASVTPALAYLLDCITGESQSDGSSRKAWAQSTSSL